MTLARPSMIHRLPCRWDVVLPAVIGASASSASTPTCSWNTGHSGSPRRRPPSAMGSAGFAEASDLSVLANNYMGKALLAIPGVTCWHPDQASRQWR